VSCWRRQGVVMGMHTVQMQKLKRRAGELEGEAVRRERERERERERDGDRMSKLQDAVAAAESKAINAKTVRALACPCYPRPERAGFLGETFVCSCRVTSLLEGSA
jgi:hypothetical protein